MFAAFVFALAPDGGIAATTRAADRGEAGKIGLPGGKLDPGESPEAAAVREAAEEGWAIEGPLAMIHSAIVDGRPVAWFATATPARQLAGHKEAGRVEPVVVNPPAIAGSGYGNRDAYAAFRQWIRANGAAPFANSYPQGEEL